TGNRTSGQSPRRLRACGRGGASRCTGVGAGRDQGPRGDGARRAARLGELGRGRAESPAQAQRNALGEEEIVRFSRSFDRFAKATAKTSGHPSTFATGVALIVIWALTGPIFRFSDTWQLVINTGTTVITFLMVFLIQNTQNRDSAALHLKLDELL